jgi:hypothetical protein
MTPRLVTDVLCNLFGSCFLVFGIGGIIQIILLHPKSTVPVLVTLLSLSLYAVGYVYPFIASPTVRADDRGRFDDLFFGKSLDSRAGKGDYASDLIFAQERYPKHRASLAKLP